MKSTRSFVVALTRVLLLALALAPIAEVATANAAATSAYKKLTLSKEFYSEGAAFADFNKDGQIDVVSGPYWYEGPDFTKRHELFTPFVFDPLKYSDNFFAFTHDFNADGWPDVLVLGFPGVDASWYQNPGPWTTNPPPLASYSRRARRRSCV